MFAVDNITHSKSQCLKQNSSFKENFPTTEESLLLWKFEIPETKEAIVRKENSGSFS